MYVSNAFVKGFSFKDSSKYQKELFRTLSFTEVLHISFKVSPRCSFRHVLPWMHFNYFILIDFLDGLSHFALSVKTGQSALRCLVFFPKVWKLNRFVWTSKCKEGIQNELSPWMAPFFMHRLVLFSGPLNKLCKSGNGANVATKSEGNLHGSYSCELVVSVSLWKDAANKRSLTP